MKRPILLAGAALALSSPAYADTLFDYVNGVQVDAAGHLEHFNAILIGDDGKVVRLIHPGEARPKAAVVVNEQERSMLPGFIDAHGHVMDLGFVALELNLTGARSLAEMQQQLREYAAGHPDDKWLIGFGWNQEHWPEKVFPTAADL